MYDDDAKEPLLRAMQGASDRDLTATLAALTAAAGHLPARHQAHPEITAARSAAEAGDWDTAWIKAHHGICLLHSTFPPDLSVCPTRPSLRTPSPASCPGCHEPVPDIARYCPACGTRVSPEEPA